jgi:hypothetical protein
MIQTALSICAFFLISTASGNASASLAPPATKSVAARPAVELAKAKKKKKAAPKKKSGSKKKAAADAADEPEAASESAEAETPAAPAEETAATRDEAPEPEVDEEAEARRKKRLARKARSENDEGEAEGDEDEDDEDGGKKKSRRKSRDADEEDEDEDSERGAIAASIAPRLINVALSASVIGRSFRFNADLQRESSFPLAGVVIEGESFPLTSMGSGFGGLGLGFGYARELGTARLRVDNTTATSLSINSQRWHVDLRYAVRLGETFVLLPSAGIGSLRHAIDGKMDVPPSQCPNSSTQICIADVNMLHLKAGVEGRLAASDALHFALALAFVPSLSMGSAAGELASEAKVSTLGFGGDLSATYRFSEWIGARAGFQLLRLVHSFTGTGITYTGASEMYYGGNLGLVVASPL